MTKARARQRAKAKAAKKSQKREKRVEAPAANNRPGRFDPGASSIKGPNLNAAARNFGTAKRGAARSN